MHSRLTPLFLRHAPESVSIRGFAMLSGFDAAVRGMLVSVMPLVVYDAFQSAALVSKVYFFVGLMSLCGGLMVPWITRFIPRRWTYTLGTVLYVLGMGLAIYGTPAAIALALLANALGAVILFNCLNAYVLDNIARTQLAHCTSTQMFYSATSWTVGPVAGVFLRGLWAPAPFVLAAVFALVLLATFWRLRLGNGKEISRARRPAVNPLAYLGRFFSQPRLIAGWLFAVIRSCAWWVYIVYLPIYCVQQGLGEHLGGIALSLSNALMFSTPLVVRMIERASVRLFVRRAFMGAAACFVLATASAAASLSPIVTVGLAMIGTCFLIALDVSGGLPFLMAVKPSERTEMAAVYSSYRDFSGIATPGIAWLALLAMPLGGIFAVAGGGLGLAGLIAARMHPRLGTPRPSHGRTLRA